MTHVVHRERYRERHRQLRRVVAEVGMKTEDVRIRGGRVGDSGRGVTPRHGVSIGRAGGIGVLPVLAALFVTSASWARVDAAVGRVNVGGAGPAGVEASAPTAAATTSSAAQSTAQSTEGAKAPMAIGARLARETRTLFGTPVDIMAWVDGPETDVAAAMGTAFEEIRRVESLVDEDNPRSAVFRVNTQAGKEPVVVDPELFFLISEVVRLGKVTKGAFDVTAAAFDAAWHFGASEDPASPTAEEKPRSALPTRSEIEKARGLVGLDDLVLDNAGRTVRLVNPGARVALRGVARGYALERAATVIEQQGIKNVVISAAGDLIVRGMKGDRSWAVGIQDPRAAGYFAALPAARGAVMTTGDYEEYFFDGGTRYHNVLDPRSGLPATQCRAVTVLAADALTAEAASRAVFVLGPREGIALAERLKVEALVVSSDNTVVLTPGLKGIVQVRSPTDGP